MPILNVGKVLHALQSTCREMQTEKPCGFRARCSSRLEKINLLMNLPLPRVPQIVVVVGRLAAPSRPRLAFLPLFERVDSQIREPALGRLATRSLEDKISLGPWGFFRPSPVLRSLRPYSCCRDRRFLCMHENGNAACGLIKSGKAFCT